MINPIITKQIVENLSHQLLAFQQTIYSREEGQRFPTPQEVNLQHKLINCLIKLMRPPKTTGRTQQSKEEIDDEQLQFLQSQYNALSAAATVKEQQPVKTGNNITAAATQQTISTAITQSDFEQYKHLLYKENKDSGHSKTLIKFKGRLVNALWLHYNLFQYCLPVADRRFIDDARKVTTTINGNHLQARIRQYLSQQGKVAA